MSPKLRVEGINFKALIDSGAPGCFDFGTHDRIVGIRNSKFGNFIRAGRGSWLEKFHIWVILSYV